MNTEKIRERLGDAEHHLSNNRIADVCIAIREALAELDKAQQPAAGLTVDEVMAIYADECRPPEVRAAAMSERFRARLTAAIEAKTRTA